MPFNLTLEWVQAELEYVLTNGCPYLGIPIRLDCPRMDAHSPTIDQFIPGAGYTQDNCIIVSWLANRMKTDAEPWMAVKLGESVARLGATRFRHLENSVHSTESERHDTIIRAS